MLNLSGSTGVELSGLLHHFQGHDRGPGRWSAPLHREGLLEITQPVAAPLDVLCITVGNHRQLEQLLAGYNTAYNLRRRRVLGGRTPAELVRERLRCRPELANPDWSPRQFSALSTAMDVVAGAKKVSQPNS